jgi:NitT/TauT family transport system substrate-binding protein
MKRMTLLLIAATATIFLTSAIGCRKHDARPKVTIAVVNQPSLINLPVTMAQQLGYFRDENVDVVIVDVQGPSRVIEALSGQSADIGASTFDSLYLSASEGKRFQAFAQMSTSPGLALAVSPGALNSVRTIKDLKGRSVGVPTLGSSSESIVRYACVHAGVPQDSPRFVALGSAQARLASLERGEVDTAMISEPTISVLSNKYGKAPVLLVDTRTPTSTQKSLGVTTYPGTALYASSEWLSKNPKLAQQIAHAVVRAQQYLRSHSAEQSAKYIPTSFQQPDPRIYANGLEASKSMYSPDGRFDPQTDAVAVDILSVLYGKVQTHRANLTGIVTNQYLPQ